MSASASGIQSATSSSTSTSTPEKFGTGSGSSNLYLVTFLATLFLLLFISCAIVLRSYILRRRFQRQLDEAMAAGILLAPRAQGSRKRRFSSEPKFYNAWLIQGGEKWNEMMPVSALPMQVKRRCRNATTPSSAQSQQGQHQISSQTPTENSRPLREQLLHTLRWRDEITVKPETVTQPEKSPRPRVDMLQVSILVAMPSANRPLNCSTSSLGKGEEEVEEVPEVVFGVTRLPYKVQTHQAI